ncbi:unnamed protein product [Rhizophagus irregularis]|nr:unnamed protein product [Rhizophagus irregularis]
MSHQDISAGGRGLGHDRSYANVTDILDEDADLFDSEEIGKPVSQGYASEEIGKTVNIVNDRVISKEIGKPVSQGYTSEEIGKTVNIVNDRVPSDDSACFEGEVIRYSGEEYLSGIPNRDDLVAENDDPEGSGLSVILNNALAKREEIPFMAVDVEESTEFKNGQAWYVLRLSGPLINGQKAVVTITGIQVFFDIFVPEDLPPDSFETKIRDILSGVTKWIKIEHVKAYPFRGYNPEKKSYLRIYTTNTKQRKIAMKAIQGKKYITASDDQFTYYRKVAREYGIQLSGWSMLREYKYLSGMRVSPLCAHAFWISIENFHPIEDVATLKDHFPISALTRDRTLVLTWDIETYSSRGMGEFPLAEYDEDCVFTICMTLHWKDDPKPLKQICLVDVESAPDPRWITIICGSQTNLLKAFALCWEAFAPDIQLGFNDSQYDWPFIMEKAKSMHLVEWMWKRMSGRQNRGETSESILQWNYYGRLGETKRVVRQETKYEEDDSDHASEFRRDAIRIKISPEDVFMSSFLKLPGCVPIDVRACFKRLYPRSEVEKGSSLKFYLKLCGLDSKADMPFIRLWKFYSDAIKRSFHECEGRDAEQESARNLHEIANYCIIDALRCQELVVKRNVINDYREVASIAYVSLFDTHYRANGMKVRNLLGAYAVKRDMLFSTIPCEEKEKGKYPGAYVFPPKKGIENRRPVTGLDFASLYPSLIMAYNLSPEKIILNQEEADIVEENGGRLHKIEFPFNGRTLRAWSVRHNNCSEKKGLYPTVLEDLFNKRVALKAKFALLRKEKERLEKLISTVEGKGKIVPVTLKIKHASLCFDYNCLNSKQFALKVYMNTFYGEAGNGDSPFFLRELAGGITTAGQYNINLVAKYVTGKGFGIKYGDTDSLYLTCPDRYYEKCDEAFAKGGLSSKEAYWTEMVKITMKVMDDFRNKVNAFLKANNGTSYLKMAYEEVLFPVCFTGKKKYFGIAHEEIVNFKPKKPFTKGIDTVKQGQTQIFRFVGEKIMREALDINNEHTIHQIVEDTLKEARHKRWDFNEFIAMATWKPKVKNQCNQRFMTRMREKGLKIPDPGERFSYVLVKGERQRDEKGRLIARRIADYMEYPETVKKYNMEIDIYYYLEKTLGMCARFINEDNRYQPPPSHKIMQISDLDEREKQIDVYSQKEAVKLLKNFIKGL